MYPAAFSNTTYTNPRLAGFWEVSQSAITEGASVAKTGMTTAMSLATTAAIIYFLFLASKHSKGLSAAAQAARKAYEER